MCNAKCKRCGGTIGGVEVGRKPLIWIQESDEISRGASANESMRGSACASLLEREWKQYEREPDLEMWWGTMKVVEVLPRRGRCVVGKERRNEDRDIPNIK